MLNPSSHKRLRSLECSDVITMSSLFISLYLSKRMLCQLGLERMVWGRKGFSNACELSSREFRNLAVDGRNDTQKLPSGPPPARSYPHCTLQSSLQLCVLRFGRSRPHFSWCTTNHLPLVARHSVRLNHVRVSSLKSSCKIWVWHEDTEH